MSIKKDSGYKKVKTIDGYDSRKYTVKKKRTCYIKVRAVNSMNDLGENNKSIRVYGSWSKPVKVRIKK